MPRQLSLSLTAATLLALATSPLSAQYQPQKGISFNLGAGYGSFDCTREECSNRQGTVAGHVAVGYRINEGIAVELGGNFSWVPLDDGLLLTYLGVRWSPPGMGRVQLNLGVGAADDTGAPSDNIGVGFVFGLSYALPVSRTVAFLPFVNRVSKGGTNVIQVGLSLGIN